MKSFEFHEPRSIAEAVQLLEKVGSKGRILAGGTDLICSYLHGDPTPEHVVSITSIEEISCIKKEKDLHIGATSVFTRINQSNEVRKHCLMIAEAAGVMGSPQIRNLATIGGNICNAVPSADSTAPLLAADAIVVAYSSKGERQIPITNFFKGPRQNGLEPDELVVDIILPAKPLHTGTIYRRYAPRRALALAVVGVAISISIKPGTAIIHNARVALAAVAPTPIRVVEAETLLEGNTLSKELIMETVEAAIRASTPRNSIRGSAEFKKDIIRALTQRCLIEAVNRAKNNAKVEEKNE